MICESDKRASQLCQVCSYAIGDAISDQLLQPLRRNAVSDRHSDRQTLTHSLTHSDRHSENYMFDIMTVCYEKNKLKKPETDYMLNLLINILRCTHLINMIASLWDIYI